MKDGGEINQTTFMHESWTWTTIRGLTEGGVGTGLRGGGQRGKREDNCDSRNDF